MKPSCFELVTGALISPTGSSYICDPPVLNTDEDWLVYIPSGYLSVMRTIAYVYGFNKSTRHGSYARIGEQRDRFMAYRSSPQCQYGPNLNLIVTCDKDFYNKFLFATEEARIFNLLDKGDRISLFKKVFNNTYIVEYDGDDCDCI